MLGVVYLFFAGIALLACLYHLLFFSWPIHDTVLAVIEDPDYLALRSEFWGALLLGLCLCLALEGIYKIRQSSAEE